MWRSLLIVCIGSIVLERESYDKDNMLERVWFYLCELLRGIGERVEYFSYYREWLNLEEIRFYNIVNFCILIFF